MDVNEPMLVEARNTRSIYEVSSASDFSRMISRFGNESIADFKHLSMTQQFYTKIHVFHGAVVL